MKLADDCVAALSEPTFGRMVYQLLSAQAHGTAYGLMQLLGNPATPQADTDVPGVTRRQVQHSSSEVAERLLIPLCIHGSMSQRYLEHYGWDPTGWRQAALGALGFWAECAKAPSPPSTSS